VTTCAFRSSIDPGRFRFPRSALSPSSPPSNGRRGRREPAKRPVIRNPLENYRSVTVRAMTTLPRNHNVCPPFLFSTISRRYPDEMLTDLVRKMGEIREPSSLTGRVMARSGDESSFSSGARRAAIFLASINVGRNVERTTAREVCRESWMNPGSSQNKGNRRLSTAVVDIAVLMAARRV